MTDSFYHKMLKIQYNTTQFYNTNGTDAQIQTKIQNCIFMFDTIFLNENLCTLVISSTSPSHSHISVEVCFVFHPIIGH